MNIVQITPGAGAMYCGNCFRDNAFVRELRRMGHRVLMVPLYLPLTLDEADESAGVPIFFGGINVYLEQVFSGFGRLPRFMRRWLARPGLLRRAAGWAAKTRAEEVGALTLSMVRGEAGNQRVELEELVGWLRAGEKPDVISLSNALLIGLGRRLRQGLGVPVICMLQGEDSFLDSLREPHRTAVWATMADRARDIDLFVAPTDYFGGRMGDRLGLREGRWRRVYNGVDISGFKPAPGLPDPPVLGYFARMCREKGVDTVVEAFLELKRRNRVRGLKLRVGGGLGPSDRGLVDELRGRLEGEGFGGAAEFCPNLDREGKQTFYRSISVLSVPALYGEAFGLYLVEAWASGVPVVQPRHASFPELIEASGGGLLCEPNDPMSLADEIERLLLEPGLAAGLGRAGRAAAVEKFSVGRMTLGMLEVFGEVTKR